MVFLKYIGLSILVLLLALGAVGSVAWAGVAYSDPPGGWDYVYTGDTAVGGTGDTGSTDPTQPTNDPMDALDGTWGHQNNSDYWDNTIIGTTKPGGVSALSEGDTHYARLQDTGNPCDHGFCPDPSNRKIYFAHALSADIGTAGETILDDGVTLSFRARLSTGSPLDDLHPAGGGDTSAWPTGGDGYVIHDGGKGNFGIWQSNGSKTISFCLALASDDNDITQDCMVMNKRNGTSPNNDVDIHDETGGNINILPIANLTQWHECWITIESDTSGDGTHKVRIWMDGALGEPTAEFHITAGTSHEYDFSYLALGVGSTPQSGAIDVDFFAYKAGVDAPQGNMPLEVNAGTDQATWWPYQRVVQLEGTVTDDDPCGLGIRTMLWTQVSGAGTVTFDPCATMANPRAAIPGTGLYNLRLQAWDEVPQDACDVMTITALQSLAGDLNLDFKVNVIDLWWYVQQFMNSSGCDDYPTGCADLNHDNTVDLYDFTEMAKNWDVEWTTVTIAATDPVASETGSDLGEFTVTRGSTAGTMWVDYEVSGTADSADYEEILNGVVVIPDGQYSTTVSVTPTNDSESEGAETVILTLQPAVGYQVGTPDSATVTIADNDQAQIESTDLIVEMDIDPYAYRVIEKSTQEVLVSQSGTQMTFAGGTRNVLRAQNITSQDTEMVAELVLDGAPGTAQVIFILENSDLVKVIYSCSGDTPTNIKEEFLDQGEHYYGIWEYPQGGNIDNRGADHDLIGFANMPDTNYASARAPFYVTNRKYGIYVDTVALGHYTIAISGKTSFDFDEDELTYYVLYGPSYENIMDTFNDLAGPAWMPPDWAFDSIWWRNDDHNDLGHYDLMEQRTIDSAQDNVEATANHLRYYRIPASAIWIDRPFTSNNAGETWGWGNMEFNPASDWFPDGTPPGQAMIDYLDARGYKLLLWIANRGANDLYDEGMANGYFFPGYTTNHPATDMRNPSAYNWFQNHLDAFVSMGVKGYKIDRGHENEHPNWVENENVYLFNKMAAEGQMARHGSDYLIHSRNAFDKSRKYLGVWNGDTDSDFGGLAVSIKNGLRCGAINFPYYGSDVGGYMSDYPPMELFARWMQFGAYSTMMEILIDPHRTIWYADDFDPSDDPNLVDITRKQCEDHHDLIPYTKSFMYQAHQTGMPVMRQLIFAYPDDTSLYDTWDEYLYGSEILVAPVVTSGATSRSVYLPDDKWLDYNDKNTTHTGPTTITASAPLDVIPLYARAGAIIPRGDILRSNNNWTPGWAAYLRIEFFPQEETNRTFDYYTGTVVLPIMCNMTSTGTINIQFDNLVYDGMLEVYTQQYGTITRNSVVLTEGVDFTYNAGKKMLTIPFSGTTTIEITDGQSLFALGELKGSSLFF